MQRPDVEAMCYDPKAVLCLTLAKSSSEDKGNRFLTLCSFYLE